MPSPTSSTPCSTSHVSCFSRGSSSRRVELTFTIPSQGIVKVTDPLLRPLRVVIKGFRNLDIAAFVTAWAVQFVAYALITRMGGDQLPVLSLAALALYQVFQLLLLIYSGALIIVIVISWVAPGSYNPMAELLGQVTEPLLAPVRRFIPPVGGLDFSVMVVLLVLMLIRNYLLPAILLSLFQ